MYSTPQELYSLLKVLKTSKYKKCASHAERNYCTCIVVYGYSDQTYNLIDSMIVCVDRVVSSPSFYYISLQEASKRNSWPLIPNNSLRRKIQNKLDEMARAEVDGGAAGTTKRRLYD